MSINILCGAQNLQIHPELAFQSSMLHNPQVLSNRQIPGMLYCMRVANHRDYYIKTATMDLPIASVFESRFGDYHQELTHAAINGGFHLAGESDFSLFLPVDLLVYVFRMQRADYTGNKEIFSMQDVRSVIESYKISLNTN